MSPIRYSDLRAGSAPRAPLRGRSAPPNPLQVMLAARSAHRVRALVYRDLNPEPLLIITPKHARQVLPHTTTSNRGCKGRGRPLPPPAQGNCYSRAHDTPPA